MTKLAKEAHPCQCNACACLSWATFVKPGEWFFCARCSRRAVDRKGLPVCKNLKCYECEEVLVKFVGRKWVYHECQCLRKGIERITDKDALGRIATTDTDTMVRETAFRRFQELHDQPNQRRIPCLKK